MIFGLIIRGPPRVMEFPSVSSRALKGQFKPTTEPRGEGPRMGTIVR